MKTTRLHHTPSETVRSLVAVVMVAHACILFTGSATAEEVFGENVRIQTTDPVLFFDDDGGRDWSLFSSSLGAQYFGLADISAMTIPFRVDGDLPTNALRVTKDSDDAVNVGIGGIPADQTNLHIRSTLGPKIRMERQGVAPQAWDIEANQFEFSITDRTAIRVPFRISTSAPNSTLYLSESGRVGLGGAFIDANSQLTIQSSLTNGLMMKRVTANPHYLRIENSGSVFRCGVQGNGDTQFGALTAGKGLTLVAGGAGKLAINASGQLSFGSAPPAITTHALVHTSTAHLTAGGTWTNASSRALKQDIEPITSDEARETVRALQPVGYRYKNELDERYVGFIAEDVPELVATRDRKGLGSMDITAVLTKVVQDQDNKLDQQRQELDQQRQELDQQRQLNAELIGRLLKLEQKLGDHDALDAKTAE